METRLSQGRPAGRRTGTAHNDGRKRTVRILHITECYDGGVGHALNTRVNATPEFEHFLLWSGLDDPLKCEGFTQADELPGGFIHRVRAVRSTIRKIKPDVIHAHSSWAGVYTRIAPLSVPVAYEPHGFKFNDPTLSRPMRLALRRAEGMLAHRTSVFGTLSLQEDRLVSSLASQARKIRIPNTPTVPKAPIAEAFKGVATKVVMSGRIVPLKGPDFFAEVATQVKESSAHLEAVWIGDGDEQCKAILHSAGVRITGWLRAEQIVQELTNAVYVHSSGSEGFPLSVLDAAARRIPIVVRRIPAFAGTHVAQADTPSAVATAVTRLSVPGEAQDHAVEVSNELLRGHDTKALHDSLVVLYNYACSRGSQTHIEGGEL